MRYLFTLAALACVAAAAPAQCPGGQCPVPTQFAPAVSYSHGHGAAGPGGPAVAAPGAAAPCPCGPSCPCGPAMAAPQSAAPACESCGTGGGSCGRGGRLFHRCGGRCR